MVANEDFTVSVFCCSGFAPPIFVTLGINFMEEGVGFEPTDALAPLVFKTSTISRSVNLPYGTPPRTRTEIAH